MISHRYKYEISHIYVHADEIVYSKCAISYGKSVSCTSALMY